MCSELLDEIRAMGTSRRLWLFVVPQTMPCPLSGVTDSAMTAPLPSEVEAGDPEGGHLAEPDATAPLGHR